MNHFRSLFILTSSLLALSTLPTSAKLFEIPKLGSLVCKGQKPCFDDPNTCSNQVIFDRCYENCVKKNKDPKKAQEIMEKLMNCHPEMGEQNNFGGEMPTAPTLEGSMDRSMGIHEDIPESMTEMHEHDSEMTMPYPDDSMGMTQQHHYDDPTMHRSMMPEMMPGMEGVINEGTPYHRERAQHRRENSTYSSPENSDENDFDTLQKDNTTLPPLNHNTLMGGLFNNIH